MRVLEQEQRYKVSSNLSNLRSFIQRRRLATVAINDNNDGVRVCPYGKLPQNQLIRLSVLKLDGSTFDILVARNGTVADLKQAIEDVFCSLPKEGHGNISWSLVWGHFCLFYEDQKLTDDKAGVRNFGIKDGDQIQFIRHFSINYSPLKRPLKRHIALSKQPPMLSSESIVQEENQPAGLDENDSSDIQENNNTNYFWDENQEHIFIPGFKLVNFVRGWFSYSTMGVFKKWIRKQESSFEILPCIA